jgi:hypothetical protein
LRGDYRTCNQPPLRELDPLPEPAVPSRFTSDRGAVREEPVAPDESREPVVPALPMPEPLVPGLPVPELLMPEPPWSVLPEPELLMPEPLWPELPDPALPMPEPLVPGLPVPEPPMADPPEEVEPDDRSVDDWPPIVGRGGSRVSVPVVPLPRALFGWVMPGLPLPLEPDEPLEPEPPACASAAPAKAVAMTAARVLYFVMLAPGDV